MSHFHQVRRSISCTVLAFDVEWIPLAATVPFGIIFSSSHYRTAVVARGPIARTILCSVLFLFCMGCISCEYVTPDSAPERSRFDIFPQGSASRAVSTCSTEGTTHLVGMWDSCTRIRTTEWVTSCCAHVKNFIVTPEQSCGHFFPVE